MLLVVVETQQLNEKRSLNSVVTLSSRLITNENCTLIYKKQRSPLFVNQIKVFHTYFSWKSCAFAFRFWYATHTLETLETDNRSNALVHHTWLLQCFNWLERITWNCLFSSPAWTSTIPVTKTETKWRAALNCDSDTSSHNQLQNCKQKLQRKVNKSIYSWAIRGTKHRNDE